jgi:beta-galactosidase
MCEFAHAMGNSTGNFREFFDIMEGHPHMQGGFIWDWVDQGIDAVGRDGRHYWAYGGDFGAWMYTHDENFCCNGLVSPDRTPHPGLMEVRKVYQDIEFELVDEGVLRVYNNMHDTDLSAFYLSYNTRRNGEYVTVVEEVELPRCPVGKSVDVAIDYATDDSLDEWTLTVYACCKEKPELLNEGHIVAEEQFVLQPYRFQNSAPEGELEVEKGDGWIVAYAGDTGILFNTRTGAVSRYVSAGRDLMAQLPEPWFWRAMTDNDWGEGFQRTANVWRTNRRKSLGAKVEEYADRLVVTGEYYLVDAPSYYTTIYTFRADGSLQVEVKWRRDGEYVPELPRFGMRMIFPADYKHFTYYGRGPWENYSDR